MSEVLRPVPTLLCIFDVPDACLNSDIDRDVTKIGSSFYLGTHGTQDRFAEYLSVEAKNRSSITHSYPTRTTGNIYLLMLNG